jgi:hypothetical protein
MIPPSDQAALRPRFPIDEAAVLGPPLMALMALTALTALMALMALMACLEYPQGLSFYGGCLR